MPTYEYACKDCGANLEVVQSFSDEPLTTCSTCGGSLRKVFGNIGIAFKGSGFYKNDSRSTSAKAGSGSGAASTDTSSQTGSDSAASSDSATGSGASTSSKDSATTKSDSSSTSSQNKAAG